ncbi:hypothetical protein ACODNH_05410 [Haloarcula sp. NS06]|uniref:hypothetical protein n=1 Tax=Haloarcula sp. NS06 TaxID=3409688 RepID=UPI003DA708B4
MTRTLYALRVPDSALEKPSQSQSLQIASNSPLNSDAPEVDTLGADPGSRPLAGVVAGKYANMLAREFEELFSATNIEVVPWFADRDDQTDAYVALEDVTLEQSTAQESRLQRFDGRLSLAGTRDSHYRALYCNPQQVDNPWGSGTDARAAVPRDGYNEIWWDHVTGSKVNASPKEVVWGEHTYVDIHDARNGLDNPVLLYEIPYDGEWEADVTVWDTYNRDRAVSETVNGAVQTIDPAWQRCFVSSHEFVGNPVVKNENLKLEFNIDTRDYSSLNDELFAYRWDGSNETYSQVSLGSSDWRIRSIDFQRIGVERVTAQTEWLNTSNDNTHRLDMNVWRGEDNALFTVPDNGTDPPSGLITRLNPIAAGYEWVSGQVSDIVAKSEVRE